MEKRKVSVQSIIALLEEGNTRPQIKEILGITNRELTAIFLHPSLKGKKAKTPMTIELVDEEVVTDIVVETATIEGESGTENLEMTEETSSFASSTLEQ